MSFPKFAILAFLTTQFAGLSHSSSDMVAESFTPITMGAAASFAAVAGTTLTNTGATYIMGDCGTVPEHPSPDFLLEYAPAPHLRMEQQDVMRRPLVLQHTTLPQLLDQPPPFLLLILAA